jgi:hypothetical protein
MKNDSIPDWLRTFARQQPLYLIAGAGMAAIFWAVTGSAPSLAVTLIYSLVLGNLAAITVRGIPPPRAITSCSWRLVFATVLLLVAMPLFVALSMALVFILTVAPPRGGFWPFLVGGWKFPSVATVIFGSGNLLYKQLSYSGVHND